MLGDGVDYPGDSRNMKNLAKRLDVLHVGIPELSRMLTARVKVGEAYRASRTCIRDGMRGKGTKKTGWSGFVGTRLIFMMVLLLGLGHGQLTQVTFASVEEQNIVNVARIAILGKQFIGCNVSLRVRCPWSLSLYTIC